MFLLGSRPWYLRSLKLSVFFFFTNSFWTLKQNFTKEHASVFHVRQAFFCPASVRPEAVLTVTDKILTRLSL